MTYEYHFIRTKDPIAMRTQVAERATQGWRIHTFIPMVVHTPEQPTGTMDLTTIMLIVVMEREVAVPA